jgi:hypothetical protein
MPTQARDLWRQVVWLLLLLQILVARPTAAQSPVETKPSRLELSCEAFPPTTTESDLVKRFGKDHVVRDSIFGFDDGPQPGTVLFRDRAEARAQVFWDDPVTRLRPHMITVRATGTAWMTLTGIVPNMTLRDLEKMNGRPFRMSGFWGEGGTGGRVISWAGGRLEPRKASGCELNVQLQPAYDGSDDQTAFRQVRSGANYSSGHPALQRLNPRVVSLSLNFR